jgi:peptidoglycan/xylan/chitin deacetylase (PgdA/CDA1 family)
VPVAAITIDTEFPDQPATDPLGVVDRLLAVLAARDIRATFFIVGSWARANPERVIAIRDAGHQVGNHSYAHCSMTRMTETGIIEDLTACHDVLAELGIETRPWFRAPYGELAGDAVGVEAAIKRAGYRHVHWHARGEDWRPGRTAVEIADMTLDDLRRRWPRPAIVLFHSWPDHAPRSLELVLDRLRSEDAQFLTVAELNWRHAAEGRIREATDRLSLRSGPPQDA